MEGSGKQALFEVKLVGATPEIILDHGLYTIKVDCALDKVRETDLSIIPPLMGDMEAAVSENTEYVGWIRKQYEQGAEVASLCAGAFIPAETGLLNGEACSIHWNTANECRKKFPEVELVDHKVITDHNGLYTSGGANSYWNLLIYLVQKFTNRDIAIRISKYFKVDMDRNNQAPFMIFEGYKHQTDERILEAQEYIEQNYKTEITIGFLSEKFNRSRRTFQRRF